MTVQERSIDRTELYLADEIFCRSGVQIVPITKIDFGASGAASSDRTRKKIMDLYFEAVHGNLQKYRSWCVKVY